MLRRIQLIHEPILRAKDKTEYISGLMGLSYMDVIEAWIYKLRGPDVNIPRNARFYFTESGWRNVGRDVIEACQKTGQRYRVIRIKENEVNVVWRDKYTGYEVAAQTRKEHK